MVRVITVLRPTSSKFDIDVYEELDSSNSLEKFTLLEKKELNTIDNISSHISYLVSKYSAEQLDIVGPKAYTQKIGQEVLEQDMIKYNHSNLKINYIH